MTDATTVNNSTEIKCSLKDDEALGVKEEEEVTVKQEFVECLVCLGRCFSYCDLITTTTSAGTSLNDFLSKFTHAGLTKPPNSSKFVCKTCLNLVNILERAELEYTKVREEFHAVISKNPLFETSVSQEQVTLEVVKNEDLGVYGNNDSDNDSEDEPLALTKKKRHRKVEKRKKRPVTEAKRKLRTKINTDHAWECTQCEVSGECGGDTALTAHMLVAHIHMEKVKKEESPDRSQSPDLNGLDDMFKTEADGFDDNDDDDSSNYLPDELSNGKQSKGIQLITRRMRKKSQTIAVKKKKDPKVMHPCDQCNARYTSVVRLEQHKLKHDDSKPPYICEVCGAHYKHKRACDIHVALHKGISDWKCEECNKLFPSKGALQRHNNIHTGKLNYQCDLCGKSFIHTSSFKMHKLSHSGVKPHACDVCGLALMTRSHLKRHKRVHSGEKRHECGVCGKRFSERYNLVAHARAHAGDAAAGAVLAGARRRLFRCAFCPERFERRYMLERHAATAHGRALERPPPTPRNTMSKLLKAQAQRRDAQPGQLTGSPSVPDGDSKINRSPESRAASGSKQQSLSGEGPGGGVSSTTWAGAYAAEFGLRSDYEH